MKYFIYLIVFIAMNSCHSIKDDYSGYIYIDKVPLANAKVIEANSKNYSFTDKKGYFNLKRANKEFVSKIIIQEGKNTDTIYLAQKEGAGGKMNFLFLSEKLDTLDLNRERMFKKQSSE
ncbi:hypothetical protein SAMN05443633_101143 [Chryseobacterium arachidis]|uniref:CarboxypepD_reg-like domain-containing protein n=1 Tax=Chryseobacterium arachidis TaxID=1416778 RepID=A0A1M4T333_9FLAO|nr:hypothetical protein [Chryseobacterium arachidis]SHE38893.1 hypothetical protein SAMN05443633_101143 [Chryseobacterium arachidis]